MIRSLQSGRYKILSQLGRGGFGITYLAHDMKLGSDVAIKRFCPANIAEESIDGTIIPVLGREEQFEEEKKKFLSEARLLAALNDVDGIVQVMDCFEEAGTFHIVMEYVKGKTLREYLEDLEILPSFEQACDLLGPVIEALRKIHRHGLIHRDICPDNIIMCENGNVKLMDFGASRESDHEDTYHTRTVLGHHGYAPPEQYLGKSRQGPWTDVYALCATIYEMITGTSVPIAPERKRTGITYLPSDYGAVISETQEQLLMERGLALNSEKRFRSIEQMMEGFFPKKDLNESVIKNKFPWIPVICIILLSMLFAILFFSKDKDTAPSGSYVRNSQKYNDFISFLNEYCTQKTIDTEGQITTYILPPETVIEKGYMSNLFLTDIAHKDVTEYISQKWPDFSVTQTETCIASTEPYGVIKTSFTGKAVYTSEKQNAKAGVIYDLATDKVVCIVTCTNRNDPDISLFCDFIAEFTHWDKNDTDARIRDIMNIGESSKKNINVNDDDILWRILFEEDESGESEICNLVICNVSYWSPSYYGKGDYYWP